MDTRSTATTQIKTILVDGATGYIGSHLVSRLTAHAPEQIHIKCLVRENSKPVDINYLTNSGAEIFEGDLKNNSVEEIFSGVDAACHLIGSIAPKKGETPASLHIEQTKHFVDYCLKAKVKKIVMVSACGAASNAKSEYHKTKWQAEQIIVNSGIPSIILRPSLVIGKTSGNRNSKLITRLETLIRNKNLVPLINGGKNKVQPIFIDDLTSAILNCLYNEDMLPRNIPIELGGAEILTLRELVEIMMKKIGINKLIIDLPIPIAILVASIAELTQAVPIISNDQIKIVQQDNICSDNKLESINKNIATSIETALSSYNWHS